MDDPDEIIGTNSGVSLWRAGCAERCTSGSEGGLEKPIDRNVDTALQSDPYTYVATLGGMAYVAFVIDLFSRMIIGWSVSRSMEKELVLEALEMALFSRDGDLSGCIHHSDAGSQYTSIAMSKRLEEAEMCPSIGTRGDSLDNAVAESTIGLYKTELTKPNGPWRNEVHLEYATLEYASWYNAERLHGTCGDIPPAEFEQQFAVAS